MPASRQGGRPLRVSRGGGGAPEWRDALLGCGRRGGGASAGPLALRGGRRARFLRTARPWHQAGDRPAAGWARRRTGGVTEPVADVRAHRVSPRHLAGRSGLGQRLGQVAQILGRTKRIATGGEDRGPGRYPARVLGAEPGHNRPLPVLQWWPEGCERGRSLLRQPAAAEGPAAGACAETPHVWLASWGGQAIQGDHPPPCCGASGDRWARC